MTNIIPFPKKLPPVIRSEEDMIPILLKIHKTLSPHIIHFIPGTNYDSKELFKVVSGICKKTVFYIIGNMIVFQNDLTILDFSKIYIKTLSKSKKLKISKISIENKHFLWSYFIKSLGKKKFDEICLKINRGY